MEQMTQTDFCRVMGSFKKIRAQRMIKMGLVALMSDETEALEYLIPSIRVALERK
jgi:hypothetical protein